MAALAMAMLAAGGARADGVLYTVDEGSFYHLDHCVGPCNCMPWSEQGPLSGTFVLTLDHQDPVYAYYALGQIAWHVDGDHGPIDLSGDGTYQIGGEVALTQAMTLDLSNGVGPDHLESGLVPLGAAFPEITITLRSSESQCNQATIELRAVPLDGSCAADCAPDGTLDLFDFLCFVNTFNAGDLGADCDGTGSLDLFDFLCFTNAFNAGC
jgi:hypothetical protein